MSGGFYFSFFPVSGRDIILFCYCSNISRLDLVSVKLSVKYKNSLFCYCSNISIFLDAQSTLITMNFCLHLEILSLDCL